MGNVGKPVPEIEHPEPDEAEYPSGRGHLMADIANLPEPELRCPKHRDADEPPRCGGCTMQQKIHAKWLKAKIAAEQDAERQREHDRELERRAEAEEERQIAIKLCHLCDEKGYRALGVVCDHVDRRETHARGMALVREELRKIAVKRARG